MDKLTGYGIQRLSQTVHMTSLFVCLFVCFGLSPFKSLLFSRRSSSSCCFCTRVLIFAAAADTDVAVVVY